MKNLTKRLALFVMLCLSTTISYSQYFGSNSKLSNSIGIVLGGDFGFRLISSSSTDAEVLDQVSNRGEAEKQKLNHRFGFNYYHGLGGSFALKTGIRIANPGFTISSINPIDIRANINSIKKSFEPNSYSYRYQYQMIEVPIGIKYVFSKATCMPFIEFGIAPNFYQKTVIEELPYEGGSTKSSVVEDINKVNFFSFASMGGSFSISNNISGFTQLIGRYQLNNLRKGALEERVISLGLEVGVKYYLR